MADGVSRIRTGGKQYGDSLTLYVVLACIVAASGGLIFGYDVGISVMWTWMITGGVTSMDSFLIEFFPKIFGNRVNENNYCRYNNQGLQIFTSSLYLAGLIASFFAAYSTRSWGRRPSMLIGGLSFFCGAILNAAAQNIMMLILGRTMLGIGLGFANQSVPLYLSEMAPAKLRGSLNIMFQLATTLGIFFADLVNYGAEKVEWGWRLALGLALVPASILTLGGVFLPETPNSLIQRKRFEDGRDTLKKIRGTSLVNEEFADIVAASQSFHAISNPMYNLLARSHRPQLCVAILIPLFQQMTGINAIMFYVPVLFKILGFGERAALYSALMSGLTNVVATCVSIGTVDRFGRKIFFWIGGAQMIICQISIGVILKFKLPIDGEETLPKFWASIILALVCIYVAGFAWSWGPLAWLVPSEVFSLEIRSAAQSITVSVNFLLTFLIGQSFLTILCQLKWGIFIFFCGWLLIMTLYITFFLPETKNIPIEEMSLAWKNHWFWTRFFNDDSLNEVERVHDVFNSKL